MPDGKRRARDLARRELPSAGGFSLPHLQAHQGARYLLTHLVAIEVAADAAAAERIKHGIDPTIARIPGALDRQAISQAVQVFSAMTIEGAVNLLGVLLLGEKTFVEALERAPLLEKLGTLLDKLVPPPAPELRQELEVLASGLSHARNAFVHPKPQEGIPSGSVGRPSNRSAAEQAFQECERFLTLLQQLDPEYRTFFLVFDRFGP